MLKPRTFLFLFIRINVLILMWISPQTVDANTAGLSSVQNIEVLSTDDSTRILIELDSDAHYTAECLANPDRIFFDISKAQLSSDFQKRNLKVKDEVLKRIRVAQNRPDLVRVVLEVSGVAEYSVSELHSPFRIVVELYGHPGKKPASNADPKKDSLNTALSSQPPDKQTGLPDSEPLKSVGTPANGSLEKDAKATPAGTSVPETAKAENPAPANEMASVRAVKYWRANNSIRAIIEMDSYTPFTVERIANPDRIYFDIFGAQLSEEFLNPTIPVKDEVLKKIRVAQNRADLVRVVFDISDAADYSVSELRDPFRIILDINGPAKAGTGADSPNQTSVSERPQSGSKPGAPAVTMTIPPDDKAGPKTSEPPAPPDPSVIVAPKQNAETKKQESEASPAEINTFSPAPQEAAVPPNSVPLSATLTPSPAKSRPLISISFTQDVDITDRPPAKPAVTRENFPRGGKPLTIDATFTTGYYNTYTRGGGNEAQQLSFVPAGAAFNINGYYLSPELLDYSIQPEFNASPQASDAGFQGGNGLQVRITGLQHKVLPVTFRYSNVQLKDAYFGSLSQLSSYTQKNRTKELGVTAQLQHVRLPFITFDWSQGSVQSDSFMPEIPDYISHSFHRNFDMNYQLKGWNLRGFTGVQTQTSNLFTLTDNGLVSSDLKQKSQQYRGSATKTFLRDSEFYVDAGSQSTSTLLLGRPIDLTSRSANMNLRLFQRKRWKTSLRAGYISNISDLLLTGFLGEMNGNGSVVPNESVLMPLQNTISNINFSGLTSVDFKHGLGIYLSADHSQVLPSGDYALRSSYLTAAGGMTYAKKLKWGNFSAQYGRSYGSGSVIGQTGQIEGQNYAFTAQPGTWDAIQLTFSVRGTNQRIFGELPAHNKDFSSEGSIGFRGFGPFQIRFGGGWQTSTFANTGSVYQMNGYTGRASIENSRFQISGSLNSSAGNSLHSYEQLYNSIGLGSVSLLPPEFMPSDFKGLTFSLHAIPMRNIELSALYTRSIQHIQNAVSNDFEIIDLGATYNFRKLQFTAGFLRSTQDYSSILSTYPETERGRFYIRMSRSLKF